MIKESDFEDWYRADFYIFTGIEPVTDDEDLEDDFDDLEEDDGD